MITICLWESRADYEDSNCFVYVYDVNEKVVRPNYAIFVKMCEKLNWFVFKKCCVPNKIFMNLLSNCHDCQKSAKINMIYKALLKKMWLFYIINLDYTFEFYNTLKCFLWKNRFLVFNYRHNIVTISISYNTWKQLITIKYFRNGNYYCSKNLI